MRKRIVNSLLVMLTCGASINAHAIGNGFYMGAMAGPATNNAPTLKAVVVPTTGPQAASFPYNQNGFTTTPANPRSTQFAARIFMGNQFNTYAAFEVGGTFISSIRYDTRGVKTYGSTDQRVRDLDVVLKGIFPFRGVNLYGKAGVAVIYLTEGGSFNPTFKPATQTTQSKVTAPTTYKDKFGPTFSVGVSYDLDQSWEADASFNSLQVGSSVGSLSYFAIGLAYHFTSKYCGQFLCDD